MEKFMVDRNSFEFPKHIREGNEASYYMTGQETLKQLGSRPDLAEELEPYISQENYKRLGEEEFQSSEEYKRLVSRIDNLGDKNQKTNLEWQKNLPAWGDKIKQYIRNIGADINDEEFNKRIENVQMHCLDLYRFWANVAKHDVGADSGGFYSSNLHLMFYRLPKNPEFSKLPQELQLENVKETLLHELLHAAAAQNRWIYFNEKKEGGRIFRGMKRRRGGISTCPSDRQSKDRLNLLDEGITQKMVADILPKILSVANEQETGILIEGAKKIYSNETKVVEALTKKLAGLFL